MPERSQVYAGEVPFDQSTVSDVKSYKTEQPVTCQIVQSHDIVTVGIDMIYIIEFHFFYNFDIINNFESSINNNIM